MDKGVSTIYEPPSPLYRPLAMRLIFRLAKSCSFKHEASRTGE